MAFLHAVPSLKKMSMVKVCGMLWKNEIKDPMDLVKKIGGVPRFESEVNLLKMERNIVSKTYTLELPDDLAADFPPLVSLVGSSCDEYVNLCVNEWGISTPFYDSRAFSALLRDVTFTNRGSVDIFDTTRRQIESGSLDRFLKHELNVSCWVVRFGHPADIKAQLSNKDHFYDVIGEKELITLLIDYVVGRSYSMTYSMTKTIFRLLVIRGFQQSTDLGLSILPLYCKLGYSSGPEWQLDAKFSPSAWASFILNLPFDQREEFYRDYGYLILIDVAVYPTHRDLFESAVRELVGSLSLGQFATVTFQLVYEISRHPRDETWVKMFKFFWESSPKTLRSEYIKEKELWWEASMTLKRLASSGGLSSFSLVIKDVNLNDLRSFALSEAGIYLCEYLIEQKHTACLTLFRDHVSILDSSEISR